MCFTGTIPCKIPWRVISTISSITPTISSSVSTTASPIHLTSNHKLKRFLPLLVMPLFRAVCQLPDKRCLVPTMNPHHELHCEPQQQFPPMDIEVLWSLRQVQVWAMQCWILQHKNDPLIMMIISKMRPSKAIHFNCRSHGCSLVIICRGYVLCASGESSLLASHPCELTHSPVETISFNTLSFYADSMPSSA